MLAPKSWREHHAPNPKHRQDAETKTRRSRFFPKQWRLKEQHESASPRSRLMFPSTPPAPLSLRSLEGRPKPEVVHVVLISHEPATNKSTSAKTMHRAIAGDARREHPV